MSGEPLHILYIAAKGRSGSTILGRVLGAIEGFAYVGEVRLGLRNLDDDRLCGCGTPVARCPTWRAVIDQFDPGMLQGSRDVFRRGLRTRHLPAALVGAEGWLRSRVSTELESGERLYRAIRSVTGARMIVDSSKSPAWGVMLSLIPSVVLHVIHLVRDPRAVAHSWSRRKPQADNSGYERGRQGPVSSAATWAVSNAWAEVCWRRATGGRLRLRYEDFAAHALAAVQSIMNLTAARPSRLPFVDERLVDLPLDHAVAGNTARMATGSLTIVPDEEWRSTMPPGARRLVASLTHPLMRRYGYAGAGRSSWAPWCPETMVSDVEWRGRV
jgi:hypothetical protein